MPRLALIIAISIAILSPAQQESRSAGGTPRFVSLEGRFSVSLPDGADFRKQHTQLIIPTPSGDAYGHLIEWQTKEGTISVGYADTFQPIKDPEAIKQFFDGATERFRRLAVASGGKIAVVKKITLDNHPGIEQRADMSTGSFIERVYLVSRRIYETVVVVKNSHGDGSRVSASKVIVREYDSAIGVGGGGRSNKNPDPRYNQRFEFKYDEKSV